LVILQYSGSNTLESMLARQAVIVEPHRVDIRSVELPPPAANQILVRTFASAISPGTELAVYTGAHQWLRDPAMQDWKFPFRPGYSAAGEIVSVGGEVSSWKVGDLVS
jgi:NADPH:quinone reductase-like Zn-dependent oxidoreductase